MPTVGEMYNCSPETKEVLNLLLREASRSWTDDLPVCILSGVGFDTNITYREDGRQTLSHDFEDKMFYFRYNNDTYFYGVFDGHDGTRAAEYARQKMPAEVLLGQLQGSETDEEIREILSQAFLSVEKGFFEAISYKLAEKFELEMQIQDLNFKDAYYQYPVITHKLQQLINEISGGTTAVVALIVKDKLFVANVGDSRALLCKTNDYGTIEVIQLSVDHNLQNEDEILRLSQLGLDVQKLKKAKKLGNQENTRCIGNYCVKGGYKDYDELRSAREEPIIAEPEIFGGIPSDDSFRFLLLMSDGLYHSLEEATGTLDANSDIAQMVLESFAVERSLHGVAQAVVNKVVRIHRDTFMSGASAVKMSQNRDDITLLVRVFNQPFSWSLSPYTSIHAHSEEEKNIGKLEENLEDEAITTTVIESLSGSSSPETSRTSLSLDEEGRIEAYVDFSSFYNNIKEACSQNLVSEDWCTPNV